MEHLINIMKRKTGSQSVRSPGRHHHRHSTFEADALDWINGTAPLGEHR